MIQPGVKNERVGLVQAQENCTYAGSRNKNLSYVSSSVVHLPEIIFKLGLYVVEMIFGNRIVLMQY